MLVPETIQPNGCLKYTKHIYLLTFCDFVSTAGKNVEPKLQLQLVIRRVKLNSAFLWLRDAARLVKTHPQVLISMVLFMTGLSLAAQLNPIVMIVLLLANPFLTAGFYRAIVQLQKQEPVRFSDLFAVFKQKQYRRIFLRLASANLLTSIPLSLLFNEILTQYEQKVGIDPLLIFGGVAMLSLQLMLFAYAIAIAYFLNEQRLFVILNASLVACWRNVGALALYGVLALLLGMLGVMTFLIGFVVILPIIQVAFFLSFSSFFALQVGPTVEQSTLEV